ncbi:hypothetical protein [Caldovatus aquaticus]|uniref:Glycosyltransferase RgtA/B/C/D-like domain-containing protein n=1 Tax=Caldovatus aquaticus TaxID=2865671 RepID=A0ABS7F8L8_9PROT|nr:hypothetical protein [Caldovatus aquaticus]MBW8271282.1 hypothetical protein [Caldovatus aquaticus]
MGGLFLGGGQDGFRMSADERAERTGEGARTRTLILHLLAIYLVIHALLLWYDSSDPGLFVLGDRSEQRQSKINAILNGGGDFWSSLFANSNPGDYLYQAFVYHIGGRYGVIVLQIALGFVGVACTVYLAALLNFPPWAMRLAGMIMILMPGSLWQPHTLVTEALYNPAVAAASLFIGIFLTKNGTEGARYLYYGLALIAVAISIRVQLAAFPFLLAAYLFLQPQFRQWRLVVPVVPISFLFSVAWLAFVVAHTGSLAMPASDHDMGTNLYNRAARIAKIAQVELDPAEEERERLSVGEFARHVRDNPAAYLRTLATDGLNLAFNPGSIILLTRYFSLGPKADDANLWTNLRDRADPREILRSVADFGYLFVACVLLIQAAWMLLLVACGVGFFQFFFANDHRSLRIFLLLLFVYSLAVLFLSGSVRWQHRTPVDFLLSLLAASGAARIAGWRSR